MEMGSQLGGGGGGDSGSTTKDKCVCSMSLTSHNGDGFTAWGGTPGAPLKISVCVP